MRRDRSASPLSLASDDRLAFASASRESSRSHRLRKEKLSRGLRWRKNGRARESKTSQKEERTENGERRPADEGRCVGDAREHRKLRFVRRRTAKSCRSTKACGDGAIFVRGRSVLRDRISDWVFLSLLPSLCLFFSSSSFFFLLLPLSFCPLFSFFSLFSFRFFLSLYIFLLVWIGSDAKRWSQVRYVVVVEISVKNDDGITLVYPSISTSLYFYFILI